MLALPEIPFYGYFHVKPLSALNPKRIDVIYTHRSKRIDVNYTHCTKRIDEDYTHCRKRKHMDNTCPKRMMWITPVV